MWERALFLDEVGELAPSSQAKLLQFLQDRTFERVGGLRTLRSDARIVAATNRDLEASVREGTFRQDLFYRLCGVRIRIPPLRERREDIAALAECFLGRFAARMGREVRLAPGAGEALASHDWPGNVRELERAAERAVAFAEGSVVGAEALLPSAPPPASEGGTLREQRREFERRSVEDALRRTGGNRTEAARLLGISRRMLQKKLKAFGVREAPPDPV